MTFRGLPPSAAWRHHGARQGFEVVFLRAVGDAIVCDGCTSAVESGEAWYVEYSIELDAAWRTRAAHIRGRSRAGVVSETRVVSDGQGHWRVDGRPLAELDGCLDLDLEASAFTNAFPVHRLGLAIGAGAQAPAAYVRATSLAPERLEQRYTRANDDEHGRAGFDYHAPRFDFACRLVYDAHGLVLEYPGIATRVA